MGNNQDDIYAARRAELDERFRSLPPAGSAEYWRCINATGTAESLPLEVLGHCLRERVAAGALRDADGIFTAMLPRIQANVEKWAARIASKARSAKGAQLREDLEQECYLKLWAELADTAPTFLLERFTFALSRLCQHVAHDVMEREGEWQRPGVETPTRIPRGQTDSLHAEPTGEDETPLSERIGDPSAQAAFDQAELSDLLDLVTALPEEKRTLILDRYWRDRRQIDIATDLGITDRMVRYRLEPILRELGVRYQGAEEDKHV